MAAFRGGWFVISASLLLVACGSGGESSGGSENGSESGSGGYDSGAGGSGGDGAANVGGSAGNGAAAGGSNGSGGGDGGSGGSQSGGVGGSGGAGAGGMGAGGMGAGGMGVGGGMGGAGGSCQPSAELCNGLDDDCDTVVDNGNPESNQGCTTGLMGVCGPGLTDCVNGAITCAQIMQASAEVCDGMDNDCNGAADDGNPGSGQMCTTGMLGECSAGTTDCSGGALQCAPNNQAAAEVCDGLDNDCNGLSDDGNPGGGATCDSGQQGVCQMGSMLCQGGMLACVANVMASAEVCDGLDNNCDGTPDDGNPGGGVNCNTGLLGQCAVGSTACQGGGIVCNPNAQPMAETCDGADNNCDGVSDDGNPGGGAACNTGLLGVCAPGTSDCSGGSLLCNQNTLASPELCDGIDNNCDGINDDGNPGGGQQCNTGQLGQCAVGMTSCSNGAVVCMAVNGPVAEMCDGIDNNCNGLIDETDPGGGLACNTGLPGECTMGTTSCQNGSVACLPNTPPSAEVCDGLDNDCNGVADNGDPGGSVACFAGGQGLCSLGTTACQNGSIACTPDNVATAEVCDGLDNDCDGYIDNGNPGGGATCNTGLPGVCSAGTMTCNGAQISCAQNIVASAEVCGNTLDDNCDGVVDENPDYDGDGWGACDNDCCNAPGFCSNSPALVNPGAFEVVGNGLDDDCDPTTSDTVAAPQCSSAVDFGPVTATEAAQAMELCQFTTANPPLPQRKWGVISAQHRLANGAAANGGVLTNMQNSQTAILANYGTNVLPQNGATMAGISTGLMRDSNDPNFIIPEPGSNFGSASTPPAVYLAGNGGALPASASCNGTCPAGSGANDSVNLRFTIRVPTNVLSFSYKFKFYTAEYAEWTCTIYNDFYLALLQSGASGIPADTNISYDSLGNPFSVNNGFFDVCQAAGCYTCPAGTAELAGTGMQGTVGGGSQWLFTTSPVVPGETMVLELMTFDVSDGVWDTNVLLDDFQWAVDPATVGTGTVG